jgi:hypothetical protein
MTANREIVFRSPLTNFEHEHEHEREHEREYSRTQSGAT